MDPLVDSEPLPKGQVLEDELTLALKNDPNTAAARADTEVIAELSQWEKSPMFSSGTEFSRSTASAFDRIPKDGPTSQRLRSTRPMGTPADERRGQGHGSARPRYP